MFDIDKKSFVIYDFETEGLNHAFTRPWELAFCVYDKGKKVHEYQAYLQWPDLNVCYHAAKATGFDQSVVDKKGKNPKEVIDYFCKFLYDQKYYILGHNILGYDSQILNVSRRELGYKADFSFIKRVIDTNAVARGIKLNRLPKEHDDFIAWQYRILDVKAKGIKTKTDILCKEYCIPYNPDKLHGALYDIEINYEILKKLVNKIDINL